MILSEVIRVVELVPCSNVQVAEGTVAGCTLLDGLYDQISVAEVYVVLALDLELIKMLETPIQNVQEHQIQLFQGCRITDLNISVPLFRQSEIIRNETPTTVLEVEKMDRAGPALFLGM